MSFYDPHTGHQIRALRSDPTGRYSLLVENDVDEPWWLGYVIGIAAGCAIAFGMWVAM